MYPMLPILNQSIRSEIHTNRRSLYLVSWVFSWALKWGDAGRQYIGNCSWEHLKKKKKKKHDWAGGDASQQYSYNKGLSQSNREVWSWINLQNCPKFRWGSQVFFIPTSASQWGDCVPIPQEGAQPWKRQFLLQRAVPRVGCSCEPSAANIRSSWRMGKCKGLKIHVQAP